MIKWEKEPKVIEFGKNFILVEEYFYEFKLPSNGDIIEDMIPIGFTYDGASVPKIAQRLIFPPMGKHNPATIVHDWHYVSNGHIKGKKLINRKESDIIYREALIKIGYSKIKSYTVYYFLRIFGRIKREF